MKIAQRASRVVSALFVLMFVFLTFAYGGGEMIDKRDSKKYKTVTIGSQTWMAENLNYVPSEGSSYFSWCYGYNESNCKKYGRLYDWNMALSVCPQGWHLPSDEEWDALEDAINGGSVGTKLKSKSGWSSNGNGTDDYGFSALPGGYRSLSSDVGNYGIWWSATEFNASYAYRRYLSYDFAGMFTNFINKENGFSVRCLRD